MVQKVLKMKKKKKTKQERAISTQKRIKNSIDAFKRILSRDSIEYLTLAKLTYILLEGCTGDGR